MNKSEVTVVVPTKDRTSALSTLLGALNAQTLEKFNISIALNSNESWNEHLDKLILALELRKIKTQVHKCLDFTFAELHKHLLDECKTEFICRLDDDHLPQTNYLSSLLSFIKSDAQIWAVGGIVLHPEIDDLDFTTNEFTATLKKGLENKFLNTYLQLKRHPNNTPLQVPDLYSTFMCRKAYLDNIGWIATDYQLSWYREETDLTLRLTNAGYKQYIDPNAITYHIRSNTGWERQERKKWEQAQQENQWIFEKRMRILCSNIHNKAQAIWQQNLDWLSQ